MSPFILINFCDPLCVSLIMNIKTLRLTQRATRWPHTISNKFGDKDFTYAKMKMTTQLYVTKVIKKGIFEQYKGYNYFIIGAICHFYGLQLVVWKFQLIFDDKFIGCSQPQEMK